MLKRVQIDNPNKLWEPADHDRLCSLHFVSGKNKYIVNSTVSGHRQFRVNFRKRYLFSPNGIVFRYFDLLSKIY